MLTRIRVLGAVHWVMIALAACAAGALLLALLIGGGHTHALNAAGAFRGSPIAGVQNFISRLKDNLVWLGGTSMTLVIAVVGVLFMAGHSRAQDYAIKTLAGLAILASVGGIVA